MPEHIVNLNERAARVAADLAERATALGCRVHTVGRACIVDAGVREKGSINAGLMMARICLADLGTVVVAPGRVHDVSLPQVVVSIDQPVAACMASQYAGWRLSVGKYFAIGSGPMRAACGTEDLLNHIGFRENHCGYAVGVLESDSLPDEQTINHIAQSCHVPPHHLTLAVARTASLAGGVQVVARSVETAMHKLHMLKFDLSRIECAYGEAPLPPVAKDDLSAIGRTNDAVLYGACCSLYVRGDDESLEQIGARLPSSASKDYGRPFVEIFKQYDLDFYKIDPMLFSPAAVNLQNIETGRTHVLGKVNHEVLARSFFG